MPWKTLMICARSNDCFYEMEGNRMKKFRLFALMCVCVLALSACGSSNTNTSRLTVITTANSSQNLYANQFTEAPTETPVSLTVDDTDYDAVDYDPSSEEDAGIGDDGVVEIPLTDTDEVTPVPTIRSEYAGATPVVIDPIDKPTATPLPALSFEYTTYDATKLHLSFEGPAGWTVDDTDSDTFIITNTSSSADYQASMTIHIASVTSDYSSSQLTSEVKNMLSNVKSSMDFSSFSPSNTASRTLLDKAGVYANYTGTLSDGTQVAGRVQATCLNKVLYTVHITYPRGYRDTYVDKVYSKMRSTIKITQ